MKSNIKVSTRMVVVMLFCVGIASNSFARELFPKTNISSGSAQQTHTQSFSFITGQDAVQIELDYEFNLPSYESGIYYAVGTVSESQFLDSAIYENSSAPVLPITSQSSYLRYANIKYLISVSGPGVQSGVSGRVKTFSRKENGTLNINVEPNQKYIVKVSVSDDIAAQRHSCGLGILSQNICYPDEPRFGEHFIGVNVGNLELTGRESTLSVKSATFTDKVLNYRPISTRRFDPLAFFSGEQHPYFNGKTPIYGDIELRAPEGTEIDSVALYIHTINRNTPRATAGLDTGVASTQLLTTVGPTGVVSITGNEKLFDVQSQDLFSQGNDEVTLQLIVKSASGATSKYEVGKFPVLDLVDPNPNFVKRYGGRDPRNGGDGWGRVAVVELIESMSSNNPDLLFNDVADIHAGEFPPHSITNHGNGKSVDITFPNFSLRNAATAQRIIDLLNTNEGRSIRRVGLLFDPTPGKAFYDAINGVVLANGKLATDIIRFFNDHDTWMHVDFK